MSFNDDEFVDLGVKEDIPVEEIDKALIEVRELELEYLEAKKASSEANAKFVDAKEQFINLLKRAGKDRWDSPDERFSGFTMSDQLKYRVPQGHENKANFFKFLKSEKVSSLLEQDPGEIFLTYATVSAQSLTPLCRKLTELAAESGESLDIPGLLAPTFETKLRSMPKRKK
jgi:hypothetical protein